MCAHQISTLTYRRVHTCTHAHSCTHTCTFTVLMPSGWFCSWVYSYRTNCNLHMPCFLTKCHAQFWHTLFIMVDELHHFAQCTVLCTDNSWTMSCAWSLLLWQRSSQLRSLLQRHYMRSACRAKQWQVASQIRTWQQIHHVKPVSGAKTDSLPRSPVLNRTFLA